jgi:hypothetical protein
VELFAFCADKLDVLNALANNTVTTSNKAIAINRSVMNIVFSF